MQRISKANGHIRVVSHVARINQDYNSCKRSMNFSCHGNTQTTDRDLSLEDQETESVLFRQIYLLSGKKILNWGFRPTSVEHISL